MLTIIKQIYKLPAMTNRITELEKYSLILFLILIISFSLLNGCDGIFPTASKPTVPSDHTDNIKGVLHKGQGNQLRPDSCSDCHTLDLQGKVTLINGVYTWAPSCYQCHGALWSRGGTGNLNLNSH